MTPARRSGCPRTSYSSRFSTLKISQACAAQWGIFMMEFQVTLSYLSTKTTSPKRSLKTTKGYFSTEVCPGPYPPLLWIRTLQNLLKRILNLKIHLLKIKVLTNLQAKPLILWYLNRRETVYKANLGNYVENRCKKLRWLGSCSSQVRCSWQETSIQWSS